MAEFGICTEMHLEMDWVCIVHTRRSYNRKQMDDFPQYAQHVAAMDTIDTNDLDTWSHKVPECKTNKMHR